MLKTRKGSDEIKEKKTKTKKKETTTEMYKFCKSQTQNNKILRMKNKRLLS